jgi:7-cyano-7-deazaguanine reductase
MQNLCTTIKKLVAEHELREKPFNAKYDTGISLIMAKTAKTASPVSKPKTQMLGKHVEIPLNPEQAILDRVPNPHPDADYVARFTCPEFTSICPVTGQPDFGILVIDYVPGKWLVESKSLKLYLTSFRNHGAFHEDCTVGIGKTLVKLLQPRWFRIGGYWYPRGGIPIDIFWQTGTMPKNIFLPDQGVAPYRGR